MAAFATAFAVLANNSDDIKVIYKELGGLDPLLKVMPPILRIIQTTRASGDTDTEAQETIKRVVFYNDNTRQRVADFQKAHGLVADGIVGDLTWRCIESLLVQSMKGK